MVKLNVAECLLTFKQTASNCYLTANLLFPKEIVSKIIGTAGQCLPSNDKWLIESFDHRNLLASPTLQCRINERDGVSNHRRPHCLLNYWFSRRSKKTSKLRGIGLCDGNTPHKGPVTRRMFPFDDTITQIPQWAMASWRLSLRPIHWYPLI